MVTFSILHNKVNSSVWVCNSSVMMDSEQGHLVPCSGGNSRFPTSPWTAQEANKLAQVMDTLGM